jgi:DnaJ-class molecular chaperone
MSENQPTTTSTTAPLCPRCKGNGDRPDKTCWLCETSITTKRQRRKWRLEVQAGKSEELQNG